ncbi:MAG: ATP-dependent Clp protease ATP-binding subunit [Deltaproteobacteria bacterium]|nr:ATP-dependent Clp protease ATP-binding subunit [Deltaproteobacteria bacterium]
MKELSVGSAIAWDMSVREAVRVRSPQIEKEHVLIGLMSLDKAVALTPGDMNVSGDGWAELKKEYAVLSSALSKSGLAMPGVRRALRARLPVGSCDHTEKVVHRSAECKGYFARAESLGLTAETSKTTAIDIACAILDAPGQAISSAISGLNADCAGLSSAIRSVALDMKNNPPAEYASPQDQREGYQALPSNTPYLDRYGKDLTKEAAGGKLGPFVGRRKEILTIIQTLARSSKNNPVLIGEAGVGKTAIVEALAIRAVQGKDGYVLSGKRIVELNMGALQGGSKYRGEYEERITRIIEEVKANPSVIVFIDEMHNLIGAGRAEGSMDAANLLKPSLARGDFRCIGATTISEYRKYVEADPALERRFERVIVTEPARDEAIEMLKGIRAKWEKHHGVRISDDALVAAVDFSIRFDADHQLPDKAIDLVDKAGARTRIPMLSMSPGRRPPQDAHVNEVSVKTIAGVLSEKTGVPLEIIMGQAEGRTKARILEMPRFLNGRVIGQDEAIAKVSDRLRTSYSGLSRKGAPLAVFLLIGPTGVGKTELARSLALYLFGNESEIIRLDMSEFMEEHSSSKLIGSPPGYVGYDEEGQLTGRLRTKPYSIVLLDEVEKAHPRIFDLFLQLFDEGRLTDSKGRTIDATSAIFVMTSNIGSATTRDKPLGFAVTEEREDKKEAEFRVDETTRFFRPEFLNRVDEVVVFKPLGRNDIRRICAKMCAEISKDVKDAHNAYLTVTDEAIDAIAAKGYSPAYGVRELKRTVDRLLKMPLSALILSGEIKEGGRWKAAPGNGTVSIQRDE